MKDPRSTEERLEDAIDALRHIEATCQRSRSQSRRLRWIQVRAQDGVDGGTAHQRINLPKSANSEEKEKVRRKKAEMLCEEMAEVLASIENDDGRIPQSIWDMRNAVLTKVRGEDQ